jgi:hypothetical protein
MDADSYVLSMFWYLDGLINSTGLKSATRQLPLWLSFMQTFENGPFERYSSSYTASLLNPDEQLDAEQSGNGSEPARCLTEITFYITIKRCKPTDQRKGRPYLL